MSNTYESKFKDMPALVERYVAARVDADIVLSLNIEQEINTYLDSNATHDAYDEQQHMKFLFSRVISQCDMELGELGSLDMLVLDPIKP